MHAKSIFAPHGASPNISLPVARLWLRTTPTSRDVELAADLEQAHGNSPRAEILSWRAHDLRLGLEAAR